MNLLGLEREVAGHAHDAEDREGVPPEGVRRASVQEVGELLQAQEGKGLVGGTGKVSDRKNLSFLSVLTVSSISTKNDRKTTKIFGDKI